MNLLECEEETGGQSRGEPLAAAVKIQMKMAESWKCKGRIQKQLQIPGLASLLDADAAGTIAA